MNQFTKSVRWVRLTELSQYDGRVRLCSSKVEKLMASKRVSLVTSIGVLRQGFGAMSSGFFNPKVQLSIAYCLETDSWSERTIHTLRILRELVLELALAQ